LHGTGFHPGGKIYGAHSALLNQRLISWEHIDAAGFESDQLTLTIDLEGLEGLPDLGGKIGLRSVIWSRGWSTRASSK
jgi:hypothetical protein